MPPLFEQIRFLGDLRVLCGIQGFLEKIQAFLEAPPTTKPTQAKALRKGRRSQTRSKSRIIC